MGARAAPVGERFGGCVCPKLPNQQMLPPPLGIGHYHSNITDDQSNRQRNSDNLTTLSKVRPWGLRPTVPHLIHG